MLFAVLALGACLLMTRLAARPAPVRMTDLAPPRARAPHRPGGADPERGDLAGLRRGSSSAGAPGSSRWSPRPRSWRSRSSLPWMIRDWLVFGSPLPGPGGDQRVQRHRLRHLRLERPADPGPLPRDRARAPARDAGRGPRPQPVQRPAAARPPDLARSACWRCRGRAAVAALRPVLILSVVTFLVTGLLFPVATTWGTFLHASGPVHVLLIVCRAPRPRRRHRPARGAAGLDAAGRLARAALGIFGSVLFSVALLPTFGDCVAADRRPCSTSSAQRMAAIGHPLDATAGPVITDFPIWMAETQRIPSLALPDEPPADVLDLAHDPAFPGTRLLVAHRREPRWPTGLTGRADADCFRPLDLGPGPAGVAIHWPASAHSRSSARDRPLYSRPMEPARAGTDFRDNRCASAPS